MKNSDSPRILLFVPDRFEAEEYGRLIESALPGANLFATSSPADFDSEIASAEIVVGWKFPRPSLVKGDGVQWIHKLSAGVDDVVGAHVPAHTVVTRSDGAVIARRMVEYVLASILSWTQRSEIARRQQMDRVWKYYRIALAEGLTIGVAGLGDVGSSMARRLKVNGLNVVGWVRSPRQDSTVSRLYNGKEQLGEFIEACDFLVLTLPYTDETHHIFGADQFRRFKKEAVLINVGRGSLVDEPAMIDAIRSGQIAGAFLDVTEKEPLSALSPLWQMPNVFVTPHISGPVVPAEVIPLFLSNYQKYLSGQPLDRVADRFRGY